MGIIELKKLEKIFKQGEKEIRAVDNISISIEENEFVVIIGPSGSGKSTLLHLLGALDKPSSGDVLIDSLVLTKMPDSKLARIRREKIGFIFQNFNLIPTLTALQNVEAAIANHSKDDRERATSVLRLVGLGQRLGHLPSLLSGGEQQRVAIARALINDPKIILADEPTGNLDSKTGEEIIGLLRDLNRKSKKTVVLITHSEYVKKFADRVIEIKDGKIV